MQERYGQPEGLWHQNSTSMLTALSSCPVVTETYPGREHAVLQAPTLPIPEHSSISSVFVLLSAPSSHSLEMQRHFAPRRLMLIRRLWGSQTQTYAHSLLPDALPHGFRPLQLLLTACFASTDPRNCLVSLDSSSLLHSWETVLVEGAGVITGLIL